MKTDREGNLFMVFNNGGIWAYKYEHPRVLNCPENDTLFNDTGTMVARRSYNALPEGVPDTMAVYSVEGKKITFPYDFPIGTTTVEVKAKGSGTAVATCSFTVTVRQVTAINAMNAPTPSMDIYPNPFTHEVAITVVNLALKEVTVEIYSMSGQKIKTLARGQKGSSISLVWKGDDEQGKMVPGGMYLVKMNGKTKKVVREE